MATDDPMWQLPKQSKKKRKKGNKLAQNQTQITLQRKISYNPRDLA